MPDAGSRPDQEHIKKLPRRAFTVAAQGNVDVIPEPARKRDMPAPPKFGDATGDIGQIEVSRAIKAKQGSQAVAHLTVTGEVEIQLQTVRDNAQPCQRGRDIRQPHAARTDDISPQRTNGIRQNDFFCEAEHEQFRTSLGLCQRAAVLAIVQLVGHLAIFHDRPNNKLREEEDIHRKRQKIFLRFDFCPCRHRPHS